MNQAASKIARCYSEHGDRGYAATKLRTDPLYAALAEHLRDSQLPLLDIGCGLGLNAFFLRSRGIHVPILGLDYDARKIDAARQAAVTSRSENLSFCHHDARTGLPDHSGNVCILDTLQFFSQEEQESLLTLAASRVAPGGMLVIRSGLRDASWRFKITLCGDWLAKATSWMKAAPEIFPTASELTRILSPHGEIKITPLWGWTPFNSHLIVMIRRKST